jgi:hypothetical protein
MVKRAGIFTGSGISASGTEQTASGSIITTGQGKKSRFWGKYPEIFTPFAVRSYSGPVFIQNIQARY